MAAQIFLSSTPRVAVATVSYRSEGVLPSFLESVKKASSEAVEIIVADNHPSAEVAAISERAGAAYLPLPGNPGYGGALNAAVALLPQTVEWVLLSNPDVVLGEHSITQLVAAGDQDSMIGSVGPRVLTPDGTVYPSARAVPSLRTGIGHALFANIWLGNPWTRAYRRDTDGSSVRRDAGWLSGSCLLVRRTALDRIAGFDTEFFMYFEDVDLGYRLGKAGYRNVYDPEASVTHSGAHSTSMESARMIAAHHASARRFLNRKYAGWALWPIRVVLTIGLSVRSAVLRRHPVHH